MILECGHCGAPLDVKVEKRVTRCNYCGTQTERERLKTIAQTTPADFKPPRKWTPPEHAKASSQKELAYRARRGPTWVSLLVLPVVLIGPGIAVWPTLAPHVHAATPSDLAQVPLDRGPAPVGDLSGASIATNGRSVRVILLRGKAGPYGVASFRWEDGDMTGPKYIDITLIPGTPLPAPHAAFAAHLHGGLDAAGDWRWGPVRFSRDAKSGYLALEVGAKYQDRPNTLRARQLLVGRQVLLHEAFGLPVTATRAELLELLGAGYPPAQMGQFDPTTPLEQAHAALQKRFPGSLTYSNTAVVVAIDHPLFYSVELDWANEPRGVLRRVRFREAPAYTQASRRDAFVTCLTRELGAPKENVTDYAKGKRNYTFALASNDKSGDRSRLDLSLSETDASLSWSDRRGGIDAPVWARLWTSLDRCR